MPCFNLVLTNIPKGIEHSTIADYFSSQRIGRVSRITQIKYLNGTSVAFLTIDQWDSYDVAKLVNDFNRTHPNEPVMQLDFGYGFTFVWVGAEFNSEIIVPGYTVDFPNEYFCAPAVPSEQVIIPTGPFRPIKANEIKRLDQWKQGMEEMFVQGENLKRENSKRKHSEREREDAKPEDSEPDSPKPKIPHWLDCAAEQEAWSWDWIDSR